MARWNRTRQARINLKTTATEHIAATAAEFAGQSATIEIVDAAGLVRATGPASVSADTAATPPVTRIRGTITAAGDVPAGTLPGEVRIKVAGGDELVAFTSGVNTGEIPLRKALRAGQKIALDLSIPAPQRLITTAPVNTLLAPSLSVSAAGPTVIRAFSSPAGTAATAVRVYRKAASGGARTLVGTITPPAAFLDDAGRTTGTQVWYEAVSVDAAGNESVPSVERSATAQAVTAAMVTTFQIKNTGAGSVTSPVAQFAPQFGRGHIPAGSIPEVRELDGTTVVPSQFDGPSTWSNAPSAGSISGGKLAIKPAGAFAAGETKTYQIWAKSGAADTTPNVTLAQVAATSEFKARFHEADSADVYEVSINDLIAANVPLWNPTGPYGWGQNPHRGYEIIQSGPIKTTYKIWAMFKRVSDGAIHRWCKAIFWIECYGSDKFGVMVRASFSGVADPVAGATAGQAKSTALLPLHYSKAVLMNGATVIREIGGANDPRLSTGQAAWVDITNGTFAPGYEFEQVKGTLTLATAVPESFLDTSMPVRLSVSAGGSLPAPLQPNTTYYLHYRSGNANGVAHSIHANRYEAMRGVYSIDITSQGSGTITATPVATLFYRNGFFMCGGSGLPDQIGFTEPEMLCAQNVQYLTRDAAAVQTYRMDVQVNRSHTQYIGGSNIRYRANNKNNLLIAFNNLSPGSDGNDDERIGWMSLNELIATVYKPLDANWRQRNRFAALWWSDYGVIYDDEATGRWVNVSNSDFPGLGVKKPQFRFGPVGTSYATPNPNTTNSPQPLFNGDRKITSGYPSNYYNQEFEASHLPCYWYGAYLMSGHDWHLHAGLDVITALDVAMDRYLGWADPRFTSTFAGFWDAGGYRGWAWGLSRILQAYIACPDSHPMRPFLKARAELTFDFWDFYFTSLASSTQKRMGLAPNASWHTNFQNGFLMMSMGMFSRRGEFAKFQPAFDKFVRKLAMNPLDADATDEATPTPTNGCLSIADVYDLKARPSGNDSGDFHPSWQAMWNQYYQSVQTPPYVCPVNSWGWGHANNSRSQPNSYVELQRGGLGALAAAGDAQAAKLYDRLTAKMQVATNFNDYPRYAIAKE